MKKLVLLFAVLFVVSNFSFSQQSDGNFCGTMEYLEKQKKENPHLEAQMQAFEEQVQLWIKENYKGKGGKNQIQSTITIPVVVHILYNTEDENLSDQKVIDQIDITTRDYAGLNPHSMGAFPSYLKANTGVEFKLAKKKPDGSPTNGIERRKTSVPSFTTNNYMKYTVYGGLDAWDPTSYLNIWVCNLEFFGGYAQFPSSGINATYGLVVRTQYFGPDGPIEGRSEGGVNTHEIGHCFELRHTWGDDQGACTGDDFCNDIPNEAYPNLDKLGGTVTDDCSSSNPGIMYMNFMDYSWDSEFANFTPDQTARIQACFASPSGPLLPLLSSNTYSPPTECETPTALKAPYLTKTTATLEWTAMYNALSYNIQYRKSGTTTWLPATSNINSVKITGLVRNTTYEYRVQTVTGSCISPFSSVRSFTTPNQDQSSSIASPVLISPANNATGVDLNPTLSWNAVANTTYRILQVSEFSDFSEYTQKTVGTLFKIYGLLNNTTYYWRVKAYNSSYSGPWSETRAFTTISPTLVQPELLLPLNCANQISLSPTLSWNSVLGATSYVLQYSLNNFTNYIEIPTANNSVSLSGLTLDTLYYWRVKAINGNDFSAWSQRWFTTQTPYLESPTLSSPTNNSNEVSCNPTFTWVPVPSASYYVFQYSTDVNFAAISGGKTTTSPTASLSGLSSGATYYWRVKAYVSEVYRGYWSGWSEVFTFTTGQLTLLPPILISPPNLATNIPVNPTLTWSTVAGANEYIVEYALNANMDGATPTTVSTPSISLSGLSLGVTYYWRVQAKNGEILSPLSTIWSFTTGSGNLAAPVLSSPANNAMNVSTSPTLSWNPVNGATSYTLQYSTSSLFTPLIGDFTGLLGTSKAISGLSTKTTYYWRVYAVNSQGPSPASSIWKFKTANSGKFSIPEANEVAVQNASLSFNPNPFSSLTHFKLEVFETDMVSIDISDFFGKNIVSLVNGFRNSGTYEFDFDGSSIPAGVYYCHLIVGNEIQTLKMVVMK